MKEKGKGNYYGKANKNYVESANRNGHFFEKTRKLECKHLTNHESVAGLNSKKCVLSRDMWKLI